MQYVEQMTEEQVQKAEEKERPEQSSDISEQQQKYQDDQYEDQLLYYQLFKPSQSQNEQNPPQDGQPTENNQFNELNKVLDKQVKELMEVNSGVDAPANEKPPHY